MIFKVIRDFINKNDKDYYSDICSVCGNKGKYIKNNKSFREGYQCGMCKSSMRYRGQASSIIKSFSENKKTNLMELAKEKNFKKLSVFEPGLIGPFRKLFSEFKHYTSSFYWEDLKFGEFKDGVQCQSLESLTYQDKSFDLVISSDIMEHVRHPWVAFKEILRVLKPGGYHIFTIPYRKPMLKTTTYPVDTSTEEDVFLEEPHYHGNGLGGKSLVYTKFGNDTYKKLEELGFVVTEDTIDSKHYDIRKLVTFITQKPQDKTNKPMRNLVQELSKNHGLDK